MKIDNRLLDRISRVVLHDKELFLWTFFVGIVVYGYEITSFSLSIDEELGMLHGTSITFISQGRWGLALLQQMLFPDSFVPFFTPLLSICLLSCTALLLQSALRLHKCESIIFCIVFISFPQFAYQIEFALQSDCVAFGLMCAGCVFISLQQFFLNRKWFWLATCILLYVFTISIYQALFFVPPVLFLLHSLNIFINKNNILNLKENDLGAEVRNYILYIIITIVSFVLYVVLTKIISIYLAIPLSSYLRDQISWLQRPFWDCIREIAILMGVHITGQGYYGEVLFGTIIIPFLGLAIYIARNFRGGACFLGYTVLCAVLVVPFLQIILLGGAQAPRTLLAQGFVLAAMWVFFFRVATLHRMIVFFLLTFFVLIATVQVSKLFFTDQLRWEADKLLANRIMTSLYTYDSQFDPQKTKLYLHGAPDVMPPFVRNGDTFGSSFFTHDGGNIYRTQAFFYVNGIAAFSRPSKDEIDSILPQVMKMPVWPRSGSIVNINGIMVIKLGVAVGYSEAIPHLSANPYHNNQ